MTCKHFTAFGLTLVFLALARFDLLPRNTVELKSLWGEREPGEIKPIDRQCVPICGNLDPSKRYVACGDKHEWTSEQEDYTCDYLRSIDRSTHPEDRATDLWYRRNFSKGKGVHP